MEVLIVLVLVFMIVGSVAGVAVSRRRSRRIELEPPPRPRGTVAPPAPRPVQPPKPVEVEEAVPELEAVPQATPEAVEEAEPEPEPAAVVVERPRFRDRLGKARQLLSGYVGGILSRGTIDEETWEDLEEALVRADVGVRTTGELLDDLRTRVKAEGITTTDALVDALKDDLKSVLAEGDRELIYEPGIPNVWLFVGVNGVGKTTTIGKVGKQQVAEGRTVVMAAGDTFRAAAAEQLELWSKRVGADLVRGAEGSDPGAVVFDAVERA